MIALLAGTRIASGLPVDADTSSAVGAIVGVAGAATQPAASDPSNCSILESSVYAPAIPQPLVMGHLSHQHRNRSDSLLRLVHR